MEKPIDLSTKLTINWICGSVMESFVYNFRKRFDVFLWPWLLFRKKHTNAFLPMPTKVPAEKKYIYFSVIRIKIQKSGFLKHTKTRPFKISLYNYRRTQNKTNSSHSFVGIGKHMCKGLLNKRTAVLSVFARKYSERFLTVEPAQSKNKTHDEKLISTFTHTLTTKVCYFWITSLDTQRDMGICNTEMNISFAATKVFVYYF